MKYKQNLCLLLIPLLLLIGCRQKEAPTVKMDAETVEKYQQELENHRLKVNIFFMSENSPLSDSLKEQFRGLHYYAIDTAYTVLAHFKEIRDGKIFKIAASGEIADYYKTMGIISFPLNGTTFELEVYRNVSMGGDTYFIPFYDATNGSETYSGGRYLDIPEIKDETFILDFNRVYQPYCVYNHEYSCPVPPINNTLKTAVRAGERL